MYILKSLISAATLAFASIPSFAAAAQAGEHLASSETIVLAQASTGDMADGEIRKIDLDTKKITIKHGEIKNLDMPGMTMLFQVRDLAMLDMVKPGDKVKFRAEKTAGGFVVTEIQLVK